MFPRTLIYFCVLMLLFSSITQAPAALAYKRKTMGKTPETPISVPVFFATDRFRNLATEKELDFGKQIIFPPDSLTYGVKREDSTANTMELDKIESLSKLGWLVYPPEATTKEKRTAFLKEQQAEDQKSCVYEGDGFSVMTGKLKESLSVSPKKGIVVFVHGCCVDFERSMQQAVQLARSVERPVVAYSWGCSMGYAGSSMAFPRTQERFNKFMINLLKEFPEEPISVVSNSIGTQLVINFCLQCRPEDYGTREINEIILSRADLDHVAFKTQLSHVMKHSKKVVVYVAKNDFQINLSGTLRWFFYPSQHGERAGHLRADLQSEPSLTVLDVSPLKMGHVIPYDSVADVIDNEGDIPKEATYYRYAHQKDNLYRVEPKEDMERQAVSSSLK